jgi:hypothetical protein
MALPEERRVGFTLFGALEIDNAELRFLSNAQIVERLVASGVSRLSADRIVAVQRGGLEPGRARRHGQSHKAV